MRYAALNACFASYEVPADKRSPTRYVDTTQPRRATTPDGR